MNSPTDARLGSDQDVVESCAQFLAETVPERPVDLSGLRRLEAGLGAHRSRPGRLFWVLGGAFAAACVVALLVIQHTRPLTFVLLNGSRGAEGHIRAGDIGAAELRFSDGSQLALAAGTQGWVTEVTSQGAKILMDGGKLRADFVHSGRARWSIGAGPFTIRVTGTTFDLKWSSHDQVLDVRMHRGTVIVEGPMATSGVPLHQGQRLVARVQDGRLLLLDALDADDATTASAVGSSAAGSGGSPEPAPAPAPAVAPALDLPLPTLSSVREKGSAATHAAKNSLSWRRQVAAGDFRGVLAEARRRGIDSVIEFGSLDEVAALADAARYARQQGEAHHALESLVARFSRTHEGRNAVFFLGGLADDQADSTGALSWYERYLNESPRGTYAEQALGRKMVLQDALKQSEARRTAELYLERYPNGPYAGSARKIMK
jgi:hypothetical protein